MPREIEQRPVGQIHCGRFRRARPHADLQLVIIGQREFYRDEDSTGISLLAVGAHVAHHHRTVLLYVGFPDAAAKTVGLQNAHLACTLISCCLIQHPVYSLYKRNSNKDVDDGLAHPAVQMMLVRLVPRQ